MSRDFSTWIKEQLDRAMLLENEDYIIFLEKGEYRKPKTQYLLSLDSAKHICMMSGSKRGVAVRKYFIEVEKKYRVAPTADLADLNNYYNLQYFSNIPTCLTNSR